MAIAERYCRHWGHAPGSGCEAEGGNRKRLEPQINADARRLKRIVGAHGGRPPPGRSWWQALIGDRLRYSSVGATRPRGSLCDRPGTGTRNRKETILFGACRMARVTVKRPPPLRAKALPVSTNLQHEDLHLQVPPTFRVTLRIVTANHLLHSYCGNPFAAHITGSTPRGSPATSAL